MNIIIRKCNSSDHEAVLKLCVRFSEGELPIWRSRDQIDATNINHVGTAMSELEEDSTIAILVAANRENNSIVGFIRLQTQGDYFTQEKVAYLANITVSENVQGQGVGLMLLNAAEGWARENGFSQLTLHVFEENAHAKKVYEEFGFSKDIIKYVKPLN